MLVDLEDQSGALPEFEFDEEWPISVRGMQPW
jgi:hypothetical protein